MAAGASYGLEEGVLQKSLLLLLLQFYVTDNGQSIYGSWSESLFLYPIFFLLIFLSFPSMLQRNPRKVRSCWQSDLSELSFIYCLLRATFPNSSNSCSRCFSNSLKSLDAEQFAVLLHQCHDSDSHPTITRRKTSQYF